MVNKETEHTGGAPAGFALAPWMLLLVGSLLIVAANFRWGVGILGWIAPLPFLRYLRITRGFASRLALALVLPVAYSVAVAKIITAPLEPAIALGFGIPIGLIFAAPYIAWGWLQRHVSRWQAALAFPFLMVAAEWAQATFTPLGSWGAAAYTQLDNLPLLQWASVAGLAGVGWIVYATPAALDAACGASARGQRRWLIGLGALLLVTQGLGHVRLAAPATDGPTTLVAAVGTDATFGGLPLPTEKELERINHSLFQRTRTAAEAGAELIVWNEGATAVLPADEASFIEKASDEARQAGVELVISYIMPISTEPLRYENKYVWFRPDGAVDHTYLKHEPVPGEPAVRGDAAPQLVETQWGPATGAICYDYDFPRLARGHARLGAGIVALPSSDWLGIDPIHTQMAAVRAIEGGMSILRSTRMGLSAGIDAHGRIRGWLSSHEGDGRILLVSLPIKHRVTIYQVVGDLWVYGGLLYLLALGARVRFRGDEGQVKS